MNSSFILKRYHSQYTTTKPLDFTPKSETIMFLAFDFNRIFYDLNAPLLLQIRPFSQYLIFKIRGIFVFCHGSMVYRMSECVNTVLCSLITPPF